MNAGMSSATIPTPVTDPFATALRYATAPYARGAATLPLGLGPAVSGTSTVLPYDFSTLQIQYGLQPGDIVASYVLTLSADQLSNAAAVDIAYTDSVRAGTVQIVIPAGTLAGTSFALASLPAEPALVLESVTEHPVPGPGQPSGPDKWALTALLGWRASHSFWRQRHAT
jgi:hypothetical protein